MNDARTTPKRLRIPVLVLLATFLAYFTGCFALEFIEGPGKAKFLAPYRIYGQWNMFTLKAVWQKQLKATALRNGNWEGIDLPSMYKARWESGPRYQRPYFLRKTGLLPLLTNSICKRLDPPAEKVRLYRVRWKRRLGQTQEAKNQEINELITWDCRRGIRQPGGTVL